MTFLTPILLAGAAAFLVPLIIHLLNRRRIIHVSWGPMHLLHEVLKQKKRRMQIEQWLLLLIRIAIPIVLALCLARPVLSALSQLPGFNKSSLIVLLDDSFSMRAPATAGPSAAEQARAELDQVLAALPRGSDAQVIRVGGAPRPLTDGPTSSFDLLSADLASLSTAGGPVSLQDSLQSAVAALSKASNASKEILVVSDFQASDWSPLLKGSSLPALDALGTDAATRPSLTLLRIPTQLSENLAIASAELSAQLVAAGQTVALKVRLQNHGKRPWQDVPVHLEADGTRLRTARISVPPEGEASLFFTHAFDTLGDHALTARLEGDSFSDDNAFHTIVQVRSQLPVVLIDGSSSDAPLSGALDFLALALAPHLGSDTPSLKDLIVTRSLDGKRLRENDLQGARVAIVGGLERPSSSLLQSLRRFAEAGGGVWLLPHEQADPVRWQREWGAEAAFWPAKVTGQAHVENPDFPARLQTQRFTHPALLYFNDPRAGRLPDGEVQHWWTLEPQGDDARVIASLDRGTPLWIERPLGRGLALQSAIPLHPGWSNLPLQPWFVPMAQRLVAWLATQDTASSFQLVGESLSQPVDPAQRELAFTLTNPLGETTEIQPEATAPETTRLKLPALNHAGIYQLQTRGTADSPPTLIAANLDPAESALGALSAQEMTELAQRIGAQTADSFDGYQRLDRSRRLGAEVWQPLLLALLVLLFSEVLLQQRLSAGRR